MQEENMEKARIFTENLSNLQALCAFLREEGYMEMCSTEVFSKKERKLIDADGTFFTISLPLWHTLQRRDTFFDVILYKDTIYLATEAIH